MYGYGYESFISANGSIELEFTIEVQSNAEQVPTHTERGRALSPVRGWGQPVAA